MRMQWAVIATSKDGQDEWIEAAFDHQGDASRVMRQLERKGFGARLSRVEVIASVGDYCLPGTGV